MDHTTAVVLGGGGLAGIGWMAGVLAALEESTALDLSTVDHVVGTSAGASVDAIVLARGSAAAYFDDLVRASRRSDELARAARLADVLPDVLAVHDGDEPVAENARRFLALSRTHSGIDPGLRRAAIARRLGTGTWPAGPPSDQVHRAVGQLASGSP